MKKTQTKANKATGTKATADSVQGVQSTIERTLDTTKAAEALGISDKTLRRWVAAGCPHDRPATRTGPMMFNAAEIGHWLRNNPQYGAVGRPKENDASILEANRRKAWALAEKYEFELAELKRQSAEGRSVYSLRLEAVSFLHGLLSQIHVSDTTNETAERLGLVAETARKFLNKVWYSDTGTKEAIPMSLASARLEKITEHVGLILTTWPMRARELVGLNEPEIVARLTQWRSEIFDGLNAQLPDAPGAAISSTELLDVPAEIVDEPLSKG